MARRNDSWGIEVGAHAIKAVRLTRTGKDVHLEEYDVLPFKQVLTTPDINVDEAVQVNLDALMQKHDLTKSNVVISVPGHLAFARFAKLPPVEPKKIPDIVRFEAVQQIPFPIDQVEWDYQVFQQQDSPDVEVGIFAITKERVMNFLANYRQVGMKVDVLTLSPLAVYNAFAYENQENPDAAAGTIYMDIGTQSTDVIIVENGGIWLRTLPIGGNNFTDALVKAFKLSFSKAEKLKREAGTSKYARQIFQAMRPVFADLVQEMQRSLGYYQSLNRDAELTRLVGVGSTFRLPGLQKFLKQQLQMEVVRPDGFKRIAPEGKEASEFADIALNMATAYGLALQGVGLETVSANVLPQHILRQRMWKAKQPWVAAAAACIAIASGAAAGRYFMEEAAYSSAKQESDPVISPVLNEARGYVTQLQQQQSDAGGDPRLRIENLRRILDYRDLWPKLLQDLADASRAIGPQAQLVSTDYNSVRQLPPSTRRRFYIQKLNAEYRPGPDPVAGSNTPSIPQEALSSEYTTETFFAEGVQAPRFAITVEGYTPYGNSASDAVRLVSDKFVGYLQAAADRNGRPYKIKVDPRSAIVRQFPVQPNGAQAGRNGQPRIPGFGGAGGFPNFNPRAGGGGSPYGGSPYGGSPYGDDMMFEGPYGGGGQMQGMNVGDKPLIPLRPLSDEQIRATGFEITWTVELERPEVARRDEARGGPPRRDPQQPAAPAQPATPDQPAAPEQPQAAAPSPEQSAKNEQEVSL